MVTIGFILKFQIFLLIFVRMFGMFVVAPFFASMIVPFKIKAILAFFIAIVLFPMVSSLGIKPSMSIVPFLLQLVGELITGLIIGFLVSVFFTAFQFAGQLFSVQMGLSVTMVFDPQAQIQLPIIGQLLSMFAVLIFLSVNAHHHLIAGVFASYQSIPFLDVVGKAGVFAKGAGAAFVQMFGASIKIALPMIATAFLISVTLGILAKTAPQLNVLMLGFPLQIVVGLSVLGLAIPLMFRFMADWIGVAIRFTMKVVTG